MIKILVFCLVLTSIIKQKECSTTRKPLTVTPAENIEKDTDDDLSETNREGKEENSRKNASLSDSVEINGKDDLKRVNHSRRAMIEKSDDTIEKTVSKTSPQLPFPLVTMNEKVYKETAQLIKMVKEAHVVPLRVKLNPKVGRFRDLEDVNEEERSYIITNFDVIESYIKGRRSKNNLPHQSARDDQTRLLETGRRFQESIQDRALYYNDRKNMDGSFYDKVNYDDRTEDYAIIKTTPTKEDLAYEREWGITKKYSWDIKKSGGSGEKKKKKATAADMKTIKKYKKIDEYIKPVKESNEPINESHKTDKKKLNNKRHKNQNVDTTKVNDDQDPDDKISIDEKQDPKPVEYDDKPKPNTSIKVNSKEVQYATRNKNSKKSDSLKSENLQKSAELSSLEKTYKPKMRNSESEREMPEWPDKKEKTEKYQNHQRLNKFSKKIDNNDYENLSRKQKNKHKKEKVKTLESYYDENAYDYRDNKKKSLGYNQKKDNDKYGNDKKKKESYYYNKNKYSDYNNKKRSEVRKDSRANPTNKDDFQLNKRIMNSDRTAPRKVKWSNEEIVYNDHSKEISKYSDNYQEGVDDEIYKNKRPPLRQEIDNNDWGSENSGRWNKNADSRETNVDRQTNDDMWNNKIKKINDSTSQETKLEDNKKERDENTQKLKERGQDFNWDRHANNNWDKVGVEKISQRTTKDHFSDVTENKRVEEVRYQNNNGNRHQTSNWNAGRKQHSRERDYDRPQKRRPRNKKNAEPSFGYGHTFLPYRGAKSVYVEDD